MNLLSHQSRPIAGMIITIMLKALAVCASCALMLYGCAVSLDRQAEADYQQCLAWQSQGHDIHCKPPPSK